MVSVLSRATRADVIREPFPHVVLPEALPAETCARLIAEFPPLEVVTQGQPYRSNQRFSYPATAALADPGVSALWREVVATHVAPGFWAQVVDLFGDDIRRRYPRLEATLGPLGSLRVGVRGRDSLDAADVLLDAQIFINTPVTGEPSRVRGGHVDNPRKLVAGLYYLRHPEDHSDGGDLELYRFRGADFVFQGAEIDPRYVEPVRTIRYAANVLVCLVNGRDSLHGVTVRGRTPATRLFLNLLAEVKRPLFALQGPRRGLGAIVRQLVSRVR